MLGQLSTLKAEFALVCDIFVCSQPIFCFIAYCLDVLNRFLYHKFADVSASRDGPQQSTVHVMMYMFPRQFGLHNVFTSGVDSKETVQSFKDYTLREDEIHAKFSSEDKVKVPKRLRGKVSELVQKLQIQHIRCPYAALLEHYCPVRPLVLFV
jgi:telomerase reverse transcriptase